MSQKLDIAKNTINQCCEKIDRRINIMEVCGTHTVSIFRSGIRSILPDNLRLISGPGCPVCVTEQSYIDTIIDIAGRRDSIIATYGDMIRVPGRAGSLEAMRPNGNIHVILSAEDALELARLNPDKTVVFAAVGFETTAPATAVVICEAIAEKIENFCVLSSHKLVIPAMKALLSGMNNNIDAFLCPGHVSAITGYGIFAPIVEQFKRPCVVAGFEPAGILEGLAEICTQLLETRAELKSVYNAVVTESGNKTAREFIEKYFEPSDGYWRGIGLIPQSTLKLKAEYEKFDALSRLDIEPADNVEIPGCKCGEVLCGLIEPIECPLFAKSCTVENPVGPCMVSSEGACAAWYKYGI